MWLVACDEEWLVVEFHASSAARTSVNWLWLLAVVLLWLAVVLVVLASLSVASADGGMVAPRVGDVEGKGLERFAVDQDASRSTPVDRFWSVNLTGSEALLGPDEELDALFATSVAIASVGAVVGSWRS